MKKCMYLLDPCRCSIISDLLARTVVLSCRDPGALCHFKSVCVRVCACYNFPKHCVLGKKTQMNKQSNKHHMLLLSCCGIVWGNLTDVETRRQVVVLVKFLKISVNLEIKYILDKKYSYFSHSGRHEQKTEVMLRNMK